MRTFDSNAAPLAKEMRRKIRESAKALGAGMYAAAQETIFEAKRRAPREEGVLEESLFAAKPRETNKTVIVDMGAGGAARAYAVIQHEEDLNHPGARAKRLGVSKVGERYFLKNAIEATAEATKATIAKFMNRFFKTGKEPRLPPKKVPTSPGR